MFDKLPTLAPLDVFLIGALVIIVLFGVVAWWLTGRAAQHRDHTLGSGKVGWPVAAGHPTAGRWIDLSTVLGYVVDGAVYPPEDVQIVVDPEALSAGSDPETVYRDGYIAGYNDASGPADQLAVPAEAPNSAAASGPPEATGSSTGRPNGSREQVSAARPEMQHPPPGSGGPAGATLRDPDATVVIPRLLDRGQADYTHSGVHGTCIDHHRAGRHAWECAWCQSKILHLNGGQ